MLQFMMNNRNQLLQMDYGKEEAKHVPRKTNYLKLVLNILVFVAAVTIVSLVVAKKCEKLWSVRSS
jgi:hypothetical protein